MAEFQEVIREKARMCNRHVACEDCPIADSPVKKEARLLCSDFTVKFPDVVEKIVMNWAAEHPEPKYPTWREWQVSEFPGNDRIMCKKIFMSAEEAGCGGKNCCNCLREPIPAHIAEKLGIEPIKED